MRIETMILYNHLIAEYRDICYKSNGYFQIHNVGLNLNQITKIMIIFYTKGGW